eukprot:scaffold27141_cov195-Isochrysis_galbana.AAC.3
MKRPSIWRPPPGLPASGGASPVGRAQLLRGGRGRLGAHRRGSGAPHHFGEDGRARRQVCGGRQAGGHPREGRALRRLREGADHRSQRPGGARLRDGPGGRQHLRCQEPVGVVCGQLHQGQGALRQGQVVLGAGGGAQSTTMFWRPTEFFSHRRAKTCDTIPPCEPRHPIHHIALTRSVPQGGSGANPAIARIARERPSRT